MQLAEGGTIIYSGRDNNNHTKEVGILMSKVEKRALMDWTAVSERIIDNSYFFKHITLTVAYIMHPREMKMKKCRMRSAWNCSCQLLDSRGMHDVLLVTGDMNSNVVHDNRNNEEIMDKHRLRLQSDNGDHKRYCLTTDTVSSEERVSMCSRGREG